MKRLGGAIVLIGIVVMGVACWLAVAEGVAADASGRGGNVVPYAVLFLFGALVAAVGAIGLLRRAGKRPSGRA